MRRLPIRLHKLLNQVLQMKTINQARVKMVKRAALSRLAVAIMSNAFKAANLDIEMGDEVLMFL